MDVEAKSEVPVRVFVFRLYLFRGRLSCGFSRKNMMETSSYPTSVYTVSPLGTTTADGVKESPCGGISTNNLSITGDRQFWDTT